MGLYVILMGVQGAGKGMQAAFIRDEYGIPHVSTGDLFRAMSKRTDDLARKVQDIMASGALVSDDLTNEIVADRLAQPDAANGVILDGYPRNQVQADFLASHLAEKGEQINGVLYLSLDLYVAFKRAYGRVTDADGSSYNIYYLNDGLDISFEEPPIENDKQNPFPARVVVMKEGEMLRRRGDDANAAAVVKRIDTYLETTRPLIDYFQGQGLLHEIDADQPVENVSHQIKALIDDLKS